MAKFTHDDVLDASPNAIKNNATRICVCSAQPTTYAEAITTYKLAIKTISSSDFTGPANGDVSGRKLTSNAHSNVNIDTGGTALLTWKGQAYYELGAFKGHTQPVDLFYVEGNLA